MLGSPPGFLKKFVLDGWYKGLIVLGAVLFVVTLIIEIKGITNIVQSFAGGFLFLSIGEWINHTDLPPIFELGTHTLLITKKLWKPKILGLMFDLIGIIFVIIAMSSILNYPPAPPIP